MPAEDSGRSRSAEPAEGLHTMFRALYPEPHQSELGVFREGAMRHRDRTKVEEWTISLQLRGKCASELPYLGRSCFFCLCVSTKTCSLLSLGVKWMILAVSEPMFLSGLGAPQPSHPPPRALARCPQEAFDSKPAGTWPGTHPRRPSRC